MIAATRSPVVLDASAIVALLADSNPAGDWVRASIAGMRLTAPTLMPYEVGNVLRRRTLAGDINDVVASLALLDLMALDVDVYPFAALAGRAWELRGNLTLYDAAYVALAELLDAPLMTLDGRMSRASGPQCTIVVYEGLDERRA
jgi:predicted nucleic acid-binding protein